MCESRILYAVVTCIRETLLLGRVRSCLRPGIGSSAALGGLGIENRIEIHMQEAVRVQSIAHVEDVQHDLLQIELLIAG